MIVICMINIFQWKMSSLIFWLKILIVLSTMMFLSYSLNRNNKNSFKCIRSKWMIYYFISNDNYLESINNFPPIDAANQCFLSNKDNTEKVTNIEWDYWYRKKGMQTSTDDVMVAFVSLFPDLENALSLYDPKNLNPIMNPINQYTLNNSQKIKYVDLGTGIGSILLMIAFNINSNNNNKFSALGIEVQKESASLLNQTIIGLHGKLLNHESDINVIHTDLRYFPNFPVFNSFKHKCNLISANPPYLSSDAGTFCKDSQRKIAHFELHGNIDDYCFIASQLLDPISGRFVFSFWTSGDERVCEVLQKHKLKINKKVLILAGKPDNEAPYLTIYDTSLETFTSPSTTKTTTTTTTTTIDIRRVSGTNSLNPRYKFIRSILHLAKRTKPLK